MIKALLTAEASSTFTSKYRDDPVAFVHDCIRWRPGERPATYQDMILAEIPKSRRVSVRGPHGLGKTALMSWAILWFALTRDGGDDWKIPTTASAWRQLTKFLWPEIRKWARRLKWDQIGREPFNERTELLSLSIKGNSGEAFALASDNSAMIEGAHAAQLFYGFDEAKTIQEDTWDSAEGAFSTGEAYWLAISTPGEPQGRFYDIHRRATGFEDWKAIHITLDDAITAGRISPAWAEQRKRQWGEESAVYQNRVLGEFASSDEDGIIPLSWIEQANERWQEWMEKDYKGELTCIGVDVGRGGDKSVLALRYDKTIMELRRNNQRDTMVIAGMTAGLLEKYPNSLAIIDVIGIGAGVVDVLRQNNALRSRIVPFNASEKTERKDSSGELRFVNWRSAAWWNMRELLDNGECALPPDDLLIGDLTAPKWRVMAGGRIQVESKDDIKKRLGRSTDDGDAVVMAFAPIKLHDPLR